MRSSLSAQKLSRVSVPGSPRPAFICIQCRAENQIPSRSAINVRIPSRCASSSPEKSPFTERLRRKIWGTDKPLGLADPYGESQLVKNLKERQIAAGENPEAELVDDEAQEAKVPQKQKAVARPGTQIAGETDDSYVAAETWEGLDRIGGATGWWEEAWDAENIFTP